MPLLSGDRLRTADGRVEVLFADGSTLHLDMRSTIDVQSDDLVRLTEGRLRLNIAGPRADRGLSHRLPCRIGADHPARRVPRLRCSKGAEETQLELAVVRGAAEVFTDQGVDPGARRRARLRERRPGAVVCVRLQLGQLGRVRSLVGGAAGRRGSACRRSTCRPTCRATRRCWTRAATGATRSRTATCGIRAWRPTGVLITTAAGPRIRATAGRGSARTASRGRRITTAAGDSPRASGSGFPRRAGRRPMSRGATRPAT